MNISARLAITAFLILAALTICGCASSSEREEAAVYATYIDDNFTKVADSNIPLKRHIICSLTSGMEPLGSLPKHIAKLSITPAQAAVDDFLSKNARQYTINEHLSFKLPYVLISDQTLNKLFESGTDKGWTEFNRKYPKHHGFLVLSRVGFSQDRQQALLYIGNQWTEAAGEGYLVLFHKQNGTWIEIAKTSCWIS
jgi:hypothetical protein